VLEIVKRKAIKASDFVRIGFSGICQTTGSQGLLRLYCSRARYSPCTSSLDRLASFSSAEEGLGGGDSLRGVL
jgi:hypothetical protein